MERFAKLLNRSRLASGCITPEQLAMAAWPGAAGKKVAAHSRATTLVRGRLVVEVEDKVWQAQLTTLRPHLLRRIEAALGTDLVREIEFRVGLPRRGPVREERIIRAPGLAADEADRIEDPMLGRIYKSKRKKAIG